MLVLITGSTGYLGNEVYNLLKHTKHKIIGTSKSNSSADYSVDFTSSLNTKHFFKEMEMSLFFLINPLILLASNFGSTVMNSRPIPVVAIRIQRPRPSTNGFLEARKQTTPFLAMILMNFAFGIHSKI